MRRYALAAAFLAACATREEAAPPAPRAAPSPVAVAAPPAPPAASKPAETREQRLIARELSHVTRARGISIGTPVPGVVLSRQAIIARIKDHVARELPPEAIRNEGTANQLLGFLPADFDYEGAEFGLLEQQIAGYYEPADKTMYLVADLPEEEAVETLAHELVHALQDSRWQLAERSKYRAGESDRSLANAALAEGDATSAMFDVTFAELKSDRTAIDLPDDVYVEKIRENLAQGPGADAPLVMRSSLAAPYLYGLLFVHALRRRGGWPAVDRAWDDPPKTTEQLLHVDKYDAREPAMGVAPPTFAALGAGWTQIDADTFGELGARIDFEDWVDPPRAARAAAGWGGDRAVLLQGADAVALAWHVRYDAGRAAPDELAKTAFFTLAPGLEKSVGKASMNDRTSFICIEREGRGPLAMARAGADLVVLAGPARTAGGTWRSGGDCALSRRWATEVLQP